jgi:hypothetical protein
MDTWIHRKRSLAHTIKMLKQTFKILQFAIRSSSKSSKLDNLTQNDKIHKKVIAEKQQ